MLHIPVADHISALFKMVFIFAFFFFHFLKMVFLIIIDMIYI